MRFRLHKGSLKESMRTEIQVEYMDELYDHLSILYGRRIGELTFEHYGYDDRIEWDTYLVLEQGVPIGMSDGKFE